MTAYVVADLTVYEDYWWECRPSLSSVAAGTWYAAWHPRFFEGDWNSPTWMQIERR